MYQYEVSPYSSINPGIGMQGQPNVGLQGAGFQSGLNYPQNVQQRFGFPQGISPYFQGAPGFSAFPFQGSPISPYQTAPFQSPVTAFQQELAGQPSYALGAQSAQLQALASGVVDPIFITELSRSARGLQDVAEHLETVGPVTGQTQPRDQEAHRKSLYAATAHIFYAFGLLSSKGIFIPGELPGKMRLEVGGPANACREFGKELERFVDRAASGRGVIEQLSTLVERGKVCYSEITRTLEGAETAEASRKKAA